MINSYKQNKKEASKQGVSSKQEILKLFNNIKSVIIIGGYGLKNIGDEAILSGIIKDITSYNKNLEFNILTYDPAYTTSIHAKNKNKIKGIPWYWLMLCLYKVDAAIIGGGTIFREESRFRVGLILLLLDVYKKLFRKKIIYYSIGVDEMCPYWLKKILRFSMNRADFVSVRDYNSSKVLKNLGVKNKINMIIDPAFSLKVKKYKNVDNLLKGYNIKPSIPALGISIRRTKKIWDVLLKENLINLVNWLAKHKIQIIFLPFSKHTKNDIENDLFFSREIYDRINLEAKKKTFVIEKDLSPKEMLYLVSLMKGMIAMRLHAMIFSKIADVEFLGISYAEKCDSFLNTIRHKIIHIRSIEFNEMKNELVKILDL